MTDLSQTGSLDIRRNLAPGLRALAGATNESSRRNPLTNVFSGRRAFRGPHMPFSLKNNERRNIFFLTSLHTIIAHRMTTGWMKKGGKSFPTTEYASCRQWRVANDPTADKGWEPTGELCGACKALGEPKAIAVAVVIEFVKYTKSDQRTVVENPVRCLIADSLTTINQLLDLAASGAAGGDLRWCAVSVSRSSNEKSPRVGDSFTISEKRKPDDVAKSSQGKEWIATFKQIDLKKAYEPLNPDDTIKALALHKKVCDMHMEGEGYESTGMAAALKGHNEADPLTEGGFGDTVTGDGGGGLDSLADAETGTGGIVETKPFDFESAPTVTAGPTRQADPAKPATAGPAKQDDPTDVIDPWGSET